MYSKAASAPRPQLNSMIVALEDAVLC